MEARRHGRGERSTCASSTETPLPRPLLASVVYTVPARTPELMQRKRRETLSHPCQWCQLQFRPEIRIRTRDFVDRMVELDGGRGGGGPAPLTNHVTNQFQLSQIFTRDQSACW
jgi:hypothetical protein